MPSSVGADRWRATPRGRRRRGALADDQLGRQLDARLCRHLAARHRQDHLGRRGRHVHERLADGRHWRPDPPGDRQVVKPDDAQVLRDVQPRLAGGLVHAQRLEVVAGEDRRRAVLEAQHRPSPVDALLDVEPAVADQVRVDRHAGLRPSPPGSRRAAPGCRGSTAGPPMTPIRRWPSPRRWRVAVRPPFQFVAPIDGVSWSGSPVGSTTTYGMPRVASWPRIDSLEVGEDGDHAGRPAGERALDPAAARRPPALHLGEDDRQLVPPGDPLHAADDLERPLALELVEDDLEQRRPRPGPGGSPIAVLADGRLDAPAGSGDTSDRPLMTFETRSAPTRRSARRCPRSSSGRTGTGSGAQSRAQCSTINESFGPPASARVGPNLETGLTIPDRSEH